MIPPRRNFPILSTATSAELRAEPTTSSSGATVFVPEGERESVTPTFRGRVERWSPLRSLFVSTMLPMISVDEIVFRRKYDADTVSSYVIYVGEEALEALGSPSIVVVWPSRHTFRFQSGRPARRLPPRLPFISSSSLPSKEE